MNKVEKFNFNQIENSDGSAISSGDFSAGLQRVVKRSALEASTDLNQAVNADFAPVAPVAKTYTEKELSDSRTAGYEEGYSKGFSAAKADADTLNKEIDACVKSIDEKLASLSNSADLAGQKQEKEVADVVLRIAKKIADTALKTNPVDEVEKIVSKSFELLFDEPKIVIYVNEGMVSQVQSRVDSLASKSGFNGQVSLEVKSGLSAGDCEVHWAGGGLSGDKSILLDEIDQMCSRLL